MFQIVKKRLDQIGITQDAPAEDEHELAGVMDDEESGRSALMQIQALLPLAKRKRYWRTLEALSEN